MIAASALGGARRMPAFGQAPFTPFERRVNPEKNARRKLKKRYGARQLNRATKAHSRGEPYSLTPKVRR